MKALLKKFSDFYVKLSKRERWILYGASLVIGGLLLDRVIIGPVIGRISFLESEIKSQEAAAQKSTHVLLRKDQIEAEGKQLSAYSVVSDLPEEKEMTSLLKEMENLAGQAAVNVLYVKPGVIEPAGGTKRYSVSMECEAEMPELVTFFHSIESSKKLYNIEKYEIQPKNKESAIARCTLTVSKTILSSA